MQRYTFLHDLRSETLDPEYRRILKPRAYLITPEEVSVARARAAASIATLKRRLADNGNFHTIGHLIRRFEPAAARLRVRTQQREKKLGRSALARDLTPAHRAAYQRLADQVMRAATTAAAKPGDIARRQLPLLPTQAIGPEDLTLAVWNGLGIAEEYVERPAHFYLERNAAVVEAMLRAYVAALPKSLALQAYPVASGFSYDSAYQAGRAFGAARIERIAMGLGGMMSDDDYRDSFIVQGQSVTLPALMPNRYIRTVATALGFWDGYRQAAGRAPRAFHVLGLGAPIMMPLMALCAWGTTDLTFDATSPIHDAVQGLLYSDVPAYMKLRVRSVALAIASGERKAWGCGCGFCAAFERRHPSDEARAQAWLRRAKRKSIEAKDLQPGGGLYAALPLLSEPKGGALRREVNFTRMGHNYWIMEQIMARLNQQGRTLAGLRAHVRKVATTYQAHTSSKRCGETIDWITRYALDQRCRS